MAGNTGAGKEGTNLAVRLISAGIAVVGALLMWVSGWSQLADYPQWSAFLGQLGGLLVATGVVTLAWDLWGRRHFARELMGMARLGTDLERSGIVRVSDQYLDDVDLWSDLFRGVRRLDIVVAYANTWRNAHRTRLQAVASDPKARIRVYLPDVNDAQTMQVLAQRFNSDVPSLQAKIREAIEDYQSMVRPGGATVEIYVRGGDLVFSCYRFDSRAVVTMYSHSRQRQTSVPTFVVHSGALFTFVKGDIDAIREQSVQLGLEGSPS